MANKKAKKSLSPPRKRGQIKSSTIMNMATIQKVKWVKRTSKNGKFLVAAKKELDGSKVNIPVEETLHQPRPFALES